MCWDRVAGSCGLVGDSEPSTAGTDHRTGKCRMGAISVGERCPLLVHFVPPFRAFWISRHDGGEELYRRITHSEMGQHLRRCADRERSPELEIRKGSTLQVNDGRSEYLFGGNHDIVCWGQNLLSSTPDGTFVGGPLSLSVEPDFVLDIVTWDFEWVEMLQPGIGSLELAAIGSNQLLEDTVLYLREYPQTGNSWEEEESR